MWFCRIRDKSGTLKNVRIFKHDKRQAIFCHPEYGPTFGSGDIRIAGEWEKEKSKEIQYVKQICD